MRVSVIGCGNISRCHLKVLSELEDVTIVSVADTVFERAEKAAEKYNCKAYSDYVKMLDEEKPDCVHICTPHYLHVEMSVAALSRGINVLCEKPCAIGKDELEAVRKAQVQSKKQFGICFQNRYNDCVVLAKKLLTEEKFGKIIAARAKVDWSRDEDYYSDDWHGSLEKEGGGVLVNQSIHTEDLLRYLIGSDVKTVTAHVFNDHLKGKIEVEDTATVLYEYQNGVKALFNATTAFALNSNVIIDIFCEECMLRIEGPDLYKIKSDGSIERLNLSEQVDFVGRSYWGNGHEALIRDFYACLKEGRKFPIDAFEGGKATEDFLAAYESSASGEAVSL